MPVSPKLVSPLSFLQVVVAALLAWLALPATAQAACTGTSGTVNLGTVSSFAAATTAQASSGTTSLACISGISVLATDTVKATISSVTNSSGSQPRLGSATGDFLPYTMCADSACSTTYAIGGTRTWTGQTLINLLGSSSVPLTFYIRTVTGTQLAAGTYTSTINVRWDWDICSGIGLLGVCLGRDTGTTTTTVNVSLVVTRDCQITAPPINFGTAAFVGSFSPVVQSVTIRCTKDAAYTVGIGDGANYSSGRRLANGGNFIAYEIYFPANSLSRWGSAGTERKSSADASTNAGIYTGTSDQTFAYKAQVLAGQSTPPAGTYSDTLVLDVQF